MISCHCFLQVCLSCLGRAVFLIPVLEDCNSICVQPVMVPQCQRPSIRPMPHFWRCCMRRWSVALRIVLSSNSMFILNQFRWFHADQIQAASASNTAHSIELGRLALLENTV